MKKFITLLIVSIVICSTLPAQAHAAEQQQVTLTIEQIVYDANEQAYYALTSKDSEGFNWVLNIVNNKEYKKLHNKVSKQLLNKQVIITYEVDLDGEIDVISYKVKK